MGDGLLGLIAPPDGFLVVERRGGGPRAVVLKGEVREFFSAADRVEIEIFRGLRTTISGVDARGRAIKRRWEFAWETGERPSRAATIRVQIEPGQEIRLATTAASWTLVEGLDRLRGATENRRVKTAEDGRAVARLTGLAEEFRLTIEAASADGALRSAAVLFDA